MEAQTDIQTYKDRGKQALAQGQGREAAIAYAYAAQLDPNDPMVHLGLAEANLALGNYDVVRIACQKVQELEPNDGVEAMTAQALLDLLDKRYDRALQDIENVIEHDPAIGYAHALRSYLLRANHQDYDANLARARAARLSYGGHFENVFPPIETGYDVGYRAAPDRSSGANSNGVTPAPSRVGREQASQWSRPNAVQRQVIRTRFTLSQYPGLVTNALIAMNVIVFLLALVLPEIADFGAQYNNLISQGQYWRVFTAMFLHANILHIAVNMFSLFFVGRAVEVLYGKWCYLLIYLVTGIIGGLTYYFLAPTSPVPSVGASGAIFGVFGALGVFYIVNRRALGPYGTGAIVNWAFWLGLNLVIGVSSAGINIADHIGGLVSGIILAAILIPRLRVGRR